MDRIAIIGLSGSGKSTFANKLGKKLSRSVIHLDKEFWTNTWEERFKNFEDWKQFQYELVKQDSWIIDGDYSKSRYIRLDRADTIIFFDIPKWLCLWRAFRRVFHSRPPFDKPEGVKEKIDWPLIKHILSYSKNKTRKDVEKYRMKCQIFIIRNNREADQLLNRIGE
jgi:adenylate kinase family enzyme